MDNGGVLIEGCGAVVELSGERVAERSPLVSAELGLTLDDALLHIWLLLIGGIEDVEPVGLGCASERVHDLVGLDIVLGRVDHDGELKAVSAEPLGDLEISDSRGVAVGEVGLGALGDIRRGVDAVDGDPSGHLLLGLPAEQDGAALTCPHDELALLVVDLSGADAVEGVLDKTHGELGVVYLVTGLHLLTETGSLAIRQTGDTEVGVLAVLEAGADAAVKGVVLIVGPCLLDLPCDIVDPAVDSGMDHLAVDLLGDGDMAGEALAELTTSDLVLDTYPLPILTHRDRSGEPDVTNLAAEVILDRSVTPGELLTGEKTLGGDTVSEMRAERLHEINCVGSFSVTGFLDDNRVSLVHVAPENLTESEPVGRENKIEGLEADSNISLISGLHRSAVATASLDERDIAPR